MGSGLAKAVRKKFPEVYDKYRREYKAIGLALGTITWVSTPSHLVFNCITQEHYGRAAKQYVDYEAVRKCLSEVNHIAKRLSIYRIAMPRIGCGLGGGDWKVVEQIVEVTLTNYEVFVYEL